MTTARNALLLLALTVFAFTAQPMTPGPTIIRACPGCTKPLRQFTLASANMRHAKWWTDGKVDAPMFPLMLSLGKCPHCQKLFWISDAKELATLSGGGSKSKWDKAQSVAEPVVEDYLRAANTPGVSRERELKARKQAWWLTNDSIRGREGRSIIWQGARQENLERLSALLDVKEDENVILKAEIARELGQFEACLKLIDRPFKVGECGDRVWAALVRKLAQAKNSKVELLCFPDNPRP